jgi:hypothetical protein
MYFEANKDFHICGSNIPLNLLSENNRMLRNETKNWFQGFKLSDIKHSWLSVPYNFDVKTADERANGNERTVVWFSYIMKKVVIFVCRVVLLICRSIS